MAGTGELLIIAGLFAAGAFIFMNKCELLQLCDNTFMGPAQPAEAEAAPAEEGAEDDGSGGGSSPTIINNQYYPMAPQPPIVIKERSRPIYTPLPPPPPRPGPRPRPQEVSDDCCTCRTSGYDGLVKCSKDDGRTWVTYQNFKYDLGKSLKECKKGCPKGGIHILPSPWDIFEPFKRCDAQYCAQYPNRCKDCPKPKPPGNPACPISVQKNGAIYDITTLTKMPDVMTMQFPPSYIKSGNCIYKIRSQTPATTSQLAYSFLGVSL